MTDDALKSEEKVKILLAEYSSLKAEITARTGHGFQVGGFAVTAMALLASASEVTWRIIALVMTICLLLAGASFLTLRHIRVAAERIRELEQDINKRAGEELLVWDTSFLPKHW